MKAWRLLANWLFPGILGSIANVVGIGSGLNSLFGSNGPQPSYSGAGPNLYTPTGQGSADQLWQSLLQSQQGSLSPISGSVSPALIQSLSQMLGINYSPLTQAGQTAGGQYGQNASTLAGYGQNLGAQAGNAEQIGQGLQTAGNAVYQAGADPQNALYQQTLQQTVDSERAGEAARGLGNSPLGQGLENQAVSNFNIDWQNNQLSRMLSGLSGMTSADQGALQSQQMAGADLSGSANMLNQVPGLTMQSASTPIGAQMTAASAPGAASSQFLQWLAQSMAPYQQTQNQIIPYLNYGTGAGANATSVLQNQNQFTANQQGTGASAIAQGLGGLNTTLNNPGSWLSQAFGGGSNTGAGAQSGGGYNLFATDQPGSYSNVGGGSYGSGGQPIVPIG